MGCRCTKGADLRKAVVLYHFLPPDEVVSAILLGELSAELIAAGWRVKAFACNRASKDGTIKLQRRSDWRGVSIHRLWRPNFPQEKNWGRLLNSLWMDLGWTLLAFNPWVHADVLIIGTDPVMSVTAAIAWRAMRPRTKIVHWCFDLYPEAAIAEGILRKNGLLASTISFLAKFAYSCCDLIVDIGPTMRDLLKKSGVDTASETFVPWALYESDQRTPIDMAERYSVFGRCNIAMLYSGSFGKAHSHKQILELARLLRKDDVVIAFSVSERCADVLRAQFSPDDCNVRFVTNVGCGNIATRLSCADVHVVTLKEEWAGVVVPSKFFGALAIGRPVLFCGNPDSDVARFIDEYKVGWVLAPGKEEAAASNIRRLLASRDELEKQFEHCYNVYAQYFAKSVTIRRWIASLDALVPVGHPTRGVPEGK